MTTVAARLGLLAASLLSTSALGQINVDYLSGITSINITQVSADSNVTINDTLGYTYRVYALTPTTQSIGDVTINSSGSNTPTLFIGQGLTVPNEELALSTSRAYNLGAISYSGGRPQLQVRVNNDITGEISFWHVVRIDAGGDILDNITHDPLSAHPARRRWATWAHMPSAPRPRPPTSPPREAISFHHRG